MHAKNALRIGCQHGATHFQPRQGADQRPLRRVGHQAIQPAREKDKRSYRKSA
jgi:hypothetical protein